MRKTLLILGLATACSATLFAGETLKLNLVPDRGLLLKGSPQEVVVKIDLSAIAQRTKAHRTPLNLAVVLDKSGSMTGAKLEKTKQAALQLVDRLAPEDVFSLVLFSDRAEVLVPAQRVEDKASLRRRIESISAGGSTALFAGVRLGADQIQEYFSSKRINRVILLSDGLANIGPSSTGDLRRLGAQLAAGGLAVTTIGVGDDYNEDLMAALAGASDANYYYVKDTEKLPGIFAKELGELLAVAAREIKIEITCPEGVKPLGFVGRSEQFENRQANVSLSQFTTGQNRYLLLRCQVSDGQPEVARVKVNYLDELNGGAVAVTDGVATIRFTADQSVADKSVNGAVVAEKELMLAAVAKDQALAQADAGNYRQAAEILAGQAATLDRAYAAAPAAVQEQIRAESSNLSTFGGRLEKGEYDSAQRKTMQSQSYNSRNSK